MSAVAEARMDKSVFEVYALGEEPSDRPYWLSQTAEARFAALELQRQIVYGYDPATTRLQRILEITERE